MNKKAEAFHMGFVLMYSLAFFVIIIVMGYTLYSTTNRYMQSYMTHDPSLENKIYAYRAINDCLSYHDDFTDRRYPGIIDMPLYTEEHVQTCYDAGSFSLQLRDLEQGTDLDRILVGFGAARNLKHYPVIIRYADATLSRGELIFGTE